MALTPRVITPVLDMGKRNYVPQLLSTWTSTVPTHSCGYLNKPVIGRCFRCFGGWTRSGQGSYVCSWADLSCCDGAAAVLKPPVGPYHTHFVGYPTLGLGSYNHKIGYLKKRLWYEPRDRSTSGSSPLGLRTPMATLLAQRPPPSLCTSATLRGLNRIPAPDALDKVCCVDLCLRKDAKLPHEPW